MRNSEERALCREMQSLLHDGVSFGLDRKELIHDLKTFSRRFSNEGLSFLTKTLPALGKAIDSSLSGNVTFSCPTSFKRCGKNAFPLFLGSALRCIFDSAGKLIEDVDPNLVRWIRTFLMFAYKVELPFNEEQTQSYCDNFSIVDEETGLITPSAIPENYRNVMRNHLSNILSGYKIGEFRDGPGISSDVPRALKRVAYVPPSKMRNHFGRDAYHQPSEYRRRPNEWSISDRARSVASGVTLLFIEAFGSCILDMDNAANTSVKNTGVSKVLFVPKDSRGPRVICCEPAANMYSQQAVRNGVYDAVESSPLTRGRVNFLDQSINQRLTFDPNNATLDLKEASDRVSYALVADLFPANVFVDMDMCRTEVCELPDGSQIRIKKFAPMGNALCFPVMALMAYTAICSAIYLKGGVLPSSQTKVFVYGDDIIVPNEYAEIAIEALESVGLLVNKNKSFVRSRFRESCGQDTFDNSTVTPLRRRKLFKGSVLRNDKGSKYVLDDGYAMHTAALMNSALDLGFIDLAIELEKSLIKLLKSPIPFGTKESSYVCHIVKDADTAWRLNELNGLSNNGKLRAYVFRDGKEEIPHTPYSRLRSSFKTRTCPITGDTSPSYLNVGLRQPILRLRTLRKWWAGSYS